MDWPAHRAGLKTGDVIVKIDGSDVSSEARFLRAVQDAADKNGVVRLEVIESNTGRVVEHRLRPSKRDGKVGISYRLGPLPLATDPTARRLTQPALRRHIERLVQSGEMKLPKPEFDDRGDKLYYQLRPIAIPGEVRDPYELAVAAQVTVCAIREHRRAAAPFWGPALAAAEKQIADMITEIDAGRTGERQFNRIFHIYQERLDELAKRMGKKGASPVSETVTYTVGVDVSPASGELKYMAAGPWIMIRIRTGKEPAWDHPGWKTAPAKAAVQIGQITRFAAKWRGGAQQGATIDVSSHPKGTGLVAYEKQGFRWVRSAADDY